MIFAFLQTLSRLFRFAENVKCRQIFQELISWGPHSNSKGEGKIRRRFFTSPTKRAIRNFHVVVVQWQQRNVQKSSSRCRRRRRWLSSLIRNTQMKNLADFYVRNKLIMFSSYRARNVTVKCKVFKTRDQREAKSTSSFWSWVKQTRLSIVWQKFCMLIFTTLDFTKRDFLFCSSSFFFEIFPLATVRVKKWGQPYPHTNLSLRSSFTTRAL